MDETLTLIRRVVESSAFLFTVGVACGYALLIGGAHGLLRSRERNRPRLDRPSIQTERAVPVTVVVPMYNEEVVCTASVRSVLSGHHAALQMIAVNDGSSDGTVPTLIETFDMVRVDRTPHAVPATAPIRGTYQSRTHPNFWLVDKDNGGRSDAVNTGIAFTTTPLFCVVDADSVLDPEAVTRLINPFLEDRRTVASGGNVRIMNGCRVREGEVTSTGVGSRFLESLQTLEYMRAFVAARLGWSRVDLLMIISGALGMFRTDVIRRLGGLDVNTIGEDMEMTIRLHRQLREEDVPYRIAYVPDAVVWTECPGSCDVLGSQRDRWHRGLTEILVKHRRLILNPRYGRLGLVGLPWTVVVEFIGPLIEAAGYIILAAGLLLGWFQLTTILPVLLFALALGMAYSVAAMALEEISFRAYGGARDVGRLLFCVLTESLGYRQLTVYWRLRGLYKYVIGDNSWGTMSRAGAAA